MPKAATGPAHRTDLPRGGADARVARLKGFEQMAGGRNRRSCAELGTPEGHRCRREGSEGESITVSGRVTSHPVPPVAERG
jgi:hypothetical protein